MNANEREFVAAFAVRRACTMAGGSIQSGHDVGEAGMRVAVWK